MRRLVLHLIVALLAFVAGVTAATLLGGLAGRGVSEGRLRQIHVERLEQRGAPARAYDCPYSRRMGELPPPPPAFHVPDVPEPPLPPSEVRPSEVKPGKVKRVQVRIADGSARVIVQQPAELN